ncbi:MAG: hypothetical protein JJU11_01790 [Candidatus Sumerlaeia bacterium]|nr:hypothetical protein [Candidatus Sumerlaeia bacterium]
MSDHRWNPWPSLMGHWFGGGQGHFYRPIPRLALYYQAVFMGHSGIGQQLVSTMLHLGCATWLLVGFIRVGKPLAGVIGCGIGLLHPAMIETVGWASSQTDLFCVFFMLGSMVVLLPTPSPMRIALSGVLAIGAYMSKETSMLLGPFIVFALVGYTATQYWIYRTRISFAVLIAAISHVALWVLYMILRKLLLGDFFVSTFETPEINTVARSFLIAYNELFFPLLPVLSNAGVIVHGNPLLLWTMWVPPILGLVAILSKRTTLGILIILFWASIVPLVRSVEVFTTVTGNHRYYYLSVWILSALVAYSINPLHALFKSHGSLVTPGLMLAFLFLVRFMGLSSENISHFTFAGNVRNNIETTIREKVHENSNSLIIIDNLPDRYFGAYIFRNGWEEFLHHHSDLSDHVILSRDATAANINPDLEIFRLRFSTNDPNPRLTPDTELMEMVRNLQNRENRGPVTPVVLPFAREEVRRIPIYLSEGIKSIGYTEGGAWRLEVTQRRPNVGVPLVMRESPSSYGRFIVELAFPDAPESPPYPSESLSAIYLPGRAERPPVSIDTTMEITRERRRYEFNLSESLDWNLEERPRWLRLDIGDRYLGRVDIYLYAFE